MRKKLMLQGCYFIGVPGQSCSAYGIHILGTLPTALQTARQQHRQDK